MWPKAAKLKDVASERPILGRFSSHLKIEILSPPTPTPSSALFSSPDLQVELPNVGKSTLFNTLTKLSIPAENFPFCTIEPNEARITVLDDRFDWLYQLYKAKSEVAAFLEIHDIAGLVKGAHQGQGLRNSFLSQCHGWDFLYVE